MEELAIHLGEATRRGTHPIAVNGEDAGEFKPPLTQELTRLLVACLQAPLSEQEQRVWGKRLHDYAQGLFKRLVLDNAPVSQAWEEASAEGR